MKAVVIDTYGPPDVQRIEEVARPVPKEDEVLVKIHASTVTRSDTGIRAAKPFIIRLFDRILNREWGLEHLSRGLVSVAEHLSGVGVAVGCVRASYAAVVVQECSFKRRSMSGHPAMNPSIGRTGSA